MKPQTIGINLAELRRENEALRERNEQLRRMLRIMSIGIKALDEAIEDHIEPEMPDQYDRG